MKRLADLKRRASWLGNVRRLCIVFGFVAPLFTLAFTTVKLGNGDPFNSVGWLGGLGVLYSIFF